MRKFSIAILSIILIAGCNSQGISDDTVYEIPKEIDITYTKGNINADVVITEYSDYECPFCSKFTLNTLPLLQKDYLETGKVLFVFKDYPIPNHEFAMKAAEATYCAGEQREDAYWKMHIKLFENQDNLTLDELMNFAHDLNLETTKFNNCLDIGKYKNLVLRNRQEGINAGVTATPTLLINDEKVVGLQPYENLVKIIETQLKK